MKKKQDKPSFIFYDAHGKRKRIFNWLIGTLLVISIIVFYFFFQSILSTSHLKNLKLRSEHHNNIFPVDAKISEKLLKYELKKDNSSKYHLQHVYNHKSVQKETYAFYVNWDENSTSSFEKNVRSITNLIPEWYHLKPNFTFSNEIDPSIVRYANKHHVKLLPLINNFSNGAFDTKEIHNLLNSPIDTQMKFINNLEKSIKTNNFAGVNIDFEAIPEGDKEKLTQFMSLLSNVFHQNHLKVTQDVPSDDKAFDYKALSKSDDRVIVMMYDEHYSGGPAGPIASNNWFKTTLSNLDIPADKLIVSVGNYGYDWTVGSKDPADPLTFSDVIQLVKDSHVKIQWNGQSGNPYIIYKDKGETHIVWFLDGVTFYNQLQTSMYENAKGIALWRLGAEDPSIWKEIKHSNDTKDTLNELHQLSSNERVQYYGQGEILRVTNTIKQGYRDFNVDKNGYITNEQYTKLPVTYEVQRYGQPKGKQVVLTFDDGPDPTYTPQILDILDKYHVKADFFVIGQNAENNPSIIKREYNSGDEIGNHTFTHPNVATVSSFETKLQLNATQRLIEELTGHSTTLFRAPYEADAEPYLASELVPIIRAQELNYTMVGEKVDPEDWARPPVKEIVNNVLTPIYNGDGHIILLHDAGGDRTNTVKALPIIIENLQKHGYQFVTVSDLLGKKRSDIMPPVPLKDQFFILYDKLVFYGADYFTTTLQWIFYTAIVLGVLRGIFLMYFALKQKRRYSSRTFSSIPVQPFVSVLIAAYNEEEVIVKTIKSILQSEYPNFEVIIVDDGSKDQTSKVIMDAFSDNQQVRLIQKENGGKATALNLGYAEARGDIVVSLDADTLISKDAISLMVRHFEDPNVAAVSGNVKVGNRKNILTNWQHVEYITGFNLERRAFDELNCITVVPGAMGAWHKQRVQEAGCLSEDTLAEDTDLTLTLLRNGYRIVYEEKAYAYTESPEDVKSLIKQRFRWSFGTLQCLWKHRSGLFNKKNKTLGFIGLPNMWLFQYFSNLISPFADLLMFIGLFSSDPLKVLIFYLAFFIFDLGTSYFAFRLEKENPKPLLSLIVQRFIYRQFMTYVVFKSILASIKGVAVGWNKLKRSGNVENTEHHNN
ncbi:glycosyltransferase [Bacillus sp. RG28]|uniref:Glycosyltransferase n=1 Tax=Gottfriedia endophytica TaxID=2820819 RepID=A0A940SJM7_9BACI|nr:glycosyltransferase [Gottfriedia endophytica]MBP0724398.1 glycosyltransferase [Gottfriedia endophytica]